MDTRWITPAVVVVALLALAGWIALSTGAVAPLLGDGYDPNATEDTPHDDYERTTATIVDGETEAELGTVEAAIADTLSKRYIGLSETDTLPEDRGMLFIHDGSDEHTYVMRNMSFGIDIVFIASNGTITAIHEAPAPGPNENGNEQQYRGAGQYILEVNRGWTAERGIEVGDGVRFER